MVHNKKGSQRERELVNFLYETPGWTSMRAPASGGGTKRELPDALTGNGSEFYAIEAKSGNGERPIYIDEEEVAALLTFAQNFGAEAVIAVRFDLENGDPAYGVDERTGWYFMYPETLYRTDSGSYRIKKETALEDGAPFVEFIGQPAAD